MAAGLDRVCFSQMHLLDKGLLSVLGAQLCPKGQDAANGMRDADNQRCLALSSP
jgi:hypothetical protein